VNTSFAFAQSAPHWISVDGITAQTFIGNRLTTFTDPNDVYFVDLGQEYQTVNLSGDLQVVVTNLVILNRFIGNDVKVLFTTESQGYNIDFSSITNLFWLSESGTATAPTSIPAHTAMLVDFMPQAGLTNTNIYARRSFGPSN
jgi:hypothetical protein